MSVSGRIYEHHLTFSTKHDVMSADEQQAVTMFLIRSRTVVSTGREIEECFTPVRNKYLETCTYTRF